MKEKLLYAKTDEWFDPETGKVGLTSYAAMHLGDIVFLDLKSSGEFKDGETFGAIESVKAASDLYLPVSGKIVEVNSIVLDNPELINEDPFDNWLVKVELVGTTEHLMTVEVYESQLGD